MGFIGVNHKLVALHIVGDGLVLAGESVGEYQRVFACKAVCSIINIVDKADTG